MKHNPQLFIFTAYCVYAVPYSLPHRFMWVIKEIPAAQKNTNTWHLTLNFQNWFGLRQPAVLRGEPDWAAGSAVHLPNSSHPTPRTCARLRPPQPRPRFGGCQVRAWYVQLWCITFRAFQDLCSDRVFINVSFCGRVIEQWSFNTLCDKWLS